MNRKLLIQNGYSVGSSCGDKGKNLYQKKYTLGSDGETIGGDYNIFFTPNLPYDLDVFDELPSYVYDYNDVKIFLNILRNVLLAQNLQDITLSKLYVSEHSASGVVLDWIYNYFRIYFSFDSKEGNFYGIISNNPEEGSFSNDFRKMDSGHYDILAKDIVDYVVKMIHA